MHNTVKNFDFYTALKRTETAEQAWACLLAAVKEFGLVEGQFFYTFNEQKFHGAEDPNTRFGVCSYDPEFVREFDAHDGYQHDVSTILCNMQDGAWYWDLELNIEQMPLELTQQQVMLEELSQDFYLNYGLTVPFRSSNLVSWGGAGLSATGISKREYYADIFPHLPYVEKLCYLFDAHVRNLNFNPVLNETVPSSLRRLSAIEQEVLRCLAAGYSLKQIADERLFKSLETINVHIRHAKQKMKVRTRDQLIARAVILGVL